eukprot:PhM_4_TR17914/c0_g1_i1/m.10885
MSNSSNNVSREFVGIVDARAGVVASSRRQQQQQQKGRVRTALDGTTSSHNNNNSKSRNSNNVNGNDRPNTAGHNHSNNNNVDDDGRTQNCGNSSAATPPTSHNVSRETVDAKSNHSGSLELNRSVAKHDDVMAALSDLPTTDFLVRQFGEIAAAMAAMDRRMGLLENKIDAAMTHSNAHPPSAAGRSVMSGSHKSSVCSNASRDRLNSGFTRKTTGAGPTFLNLAAGEHGDDQSSDDDDEHSAGNDADIGQTVSNDDSAVFGQFRHLHASAITHSNHGNSILAANSALGTSTTFALDQLNVATSHMGASGIASPRRAAGRKLLRQSVFIPRNVRVAGGLNQSNGNMLIPDRTLRLHSSGTTVSATPTPPTTTSTPQMPSADPLLYGATTPPQDGTEGRTVSPPPLLSPNAIEMETHSAHDVSQLSILDTSGDQSSAAGPPATDTPVKKNKSGSIAMPILTAALALAGEDECLLPESSRVTSIEMAYFLSCLFEVFYISATIGFGVWDTHPVPAVIFALALCTFTSISYFVINHFVSVTHQWNLIDSREAVRNLYRRTRWYTFDCIFCVPFDLFFLAVPEPAVFRTLSLLRLLRGLRIPHLFNCSNPLVPQRQIRGATIFLMCVVYGHSFAATIWMLLNRDDVRKNHNSVTSLISGFYWAVQLSTSVGIGDVVTPNSNEWYVRLVTTVMMLIGVSAYGYMISTMSVRVMQTSRVEEAVREKKEKMNAMMEFYDVPWDIQKEAFALYPRLLFANKSDFQDVLSVLPPFMQDEIAYYVRRKLVSQVAVFRRAPEEVVQELTLALEEELVAPGELVMAYKEIGSEMFFVAHGVVEVTGVIESTGEEFQLALLHDGSWFGEIALVKDTPRTANVRTVTSCHLMVLSKERFREISERFPQSNFAREIEAETERRIQELVLRHGALDGVGAPRSKEQNVRSVVMAVGGTSVEAPGSSGSRTGVPPRLATSSSSTAMTDMALRMAMSTSTQSSGTSSSALQQQQHHIMHRPSMSTSTRLSPSQQPLQPPTMPSLMQ